MLQATKFKIIVALRVEGQHVFIEIQPSCCDVYFGI